MFRGEQNRQYWCHKHTFNGYVQSLVTVRLMTLTLFPMAEVRELRRRPAVAPPPPPTTPHEPSSSPHPRADVASEREQRLICAPSVCSAVNAESAKPRPNQCLGGLRPTCPREHINVRSPGDPRRLPHPPPPGPRCSWQDDLSLLLS